MGHPGCSGSWSGHTRAPVCVTLGRCKVAWTLGPSLTPLLVFQEEPWPLWPTAPTTEASVFALKLLFGNWLRARLPPGLQFPQGCGRLSCPRAPCTWRNRCSGDAS